MENKSDGRFVEEYINFIRNNSEYRNKLKKDPKGELCKLHNVDPAEMAQVEFEIIDQEDDVITILIPTKPDDYKPEQSQRVKAIAHRTIDFLYSKGIPGYLIPVEGLRWALLKMRYNWMKKHSVYKENE
jgi:hypothetical protein